MARRIACGSTADRPTAAEPAPPCAAGPTVSYLILAIVALSAATTIAGSGANSSFGPKLCPVVTAQVRKGVSAAAFGLDRGTIA